MKTNILFACDTEKSRAWHRDRLPSINSAIQNVGFVCKVVDLYSLLGNFDKSPADTKYRKYFFQRANIEKINENFIENVQKHHPDILLIGTADNYRDFLLPRTIRKIRQKGILVSGILGDDEFNYPQYKFFVGWFDLFVVYVKSCLNYYENLKLSKGYFFPNSCYLKSKQFPQCQDQIEYDVAIVGAPIANRPNIIKALVDSGVKLAIYGSEQWLKYNYARNSYHGYVETKNFDKVLSKSKIILALLEDHLTGKLHMNTKIWEAVRVGRLPIATYYEPLINDYNLKEGEDIVMYKNISDLRDKVIFYANNEKERIKIAKNLYDKVYNDFNYCDLYKKLFNTLMIQIPKNVSNNRNISNKKIKSLLRKQHKAYYYSNSCIIDPCVLDVVKIIRSEECNYDLIFFNKIERGFQVLQRKPFISLDTIIFLLPAENKFYKIYILIKALLRGRALHIKQFCVSSESKTLFGAINNTIDLCLYSKLASRVKRFVYKSLLLKSIIHKTFY